MQMGVSFTLPNKGLFPTFSLQSVVAGDMLQAPKIEVRDDMGRGVRTQRPVLLSLQPVDPFPNPRAKLEAQISPYSCCLHPNCTLMLEDTRCPECCIPGTIECALCVLPDMFGRADFTGVRVNETGIYSFNYTFREPAGDHVYNHADSPFTINSVSL
jgi:hypothetical protein